MSNEERLAFTQDMSDLIKSRFPSPFLYGLSIVHLKGAEEQQSLWFSNIEPKVSIELLKSAIKVLEQNINNPAINVGKIKE